MKQCFVFLKTLSPVQPPHPQIQIPRERHPHQIRQHQPCGRLRDAVKGNGSGEDQDPQSDQPQKGEKIPSQVEEPDGPEKIKNKLYGIQGEGFRVLTFLHDNEIRGDSHEDEQDAPHHREEPHGRRQEFCGSSEDTHAMAARYYRIIMGGMIFNVLSMGINAAQRGAGNTMIALRTNLISNLVNICGILHFWVYSGTGNDRYLDGHSGGSGIQISVCVDSVPTGKMGDN